MLTDSIIDVLILCKFLKSIAAVNMNNLNEESYIKAYQNFGDAIFRHCYFRISNKANAEDMTQNVFMKAWEYLEKGNEVKNLRALLYKIAGDLIVDEYRRKKADSLERMIEEGFEPLGSNGSEIQNLAEGKDMLRLMQTLDPKYREAVVMRFIDDLSPKEIAEIIGESENNVSVRINRALNKVRQLINHEEKS